MNIYCTTALFIENDEFFYAMQKFILLLQTGKLRFQHTVPVHLFTNFHFTTHHCILQYIAHLHNMLSILYKCSKLRLRMFLSVITHASKQTTRLSAVCHIKLPARQHIDVFCQLIVFLIVDHISVYFTSLTSCQSFCFSFLSIS